MNMIFEINLTENLLYKQFYLLFKVKTTKKKTFSVISHIHLKTFIKIHFSNVTILKF